MSVTATTISIVLTIVFPAKSKSIHFAFFSLRPLRRVERLKWVKTMNWRTAQRHKRKRQRQRDKSKSIWFRWVIWRHAKVFILSCEFRLVFVCFHAIRHRRRSQLCELFHRWLSFYWICALQLKCVLTQVSLEKQNTVWRIRRVKRHKNSTWKWEKPKMNGFSFDGEKNENEKVFLFLLKMVFVTASIE